MPITDSSRKAKARYYDKAMERFCMDLKKGTKESWLIQAKEKGFVSLTGYIKSLIDKDK